MPAKILLDSVITALTDFAILTMDPNGRLMEWNRAAEKMFGAERCVVDRCVSTFDADDERSEHHY